MARHQPADVRRAQIFQAALEVCADKGLQAARIDDIAARAGLSKGAVYHHFRSKQELFLGIVELYCDQAREKIESLGERGAPAPEIFDALLSQMLAEVEAQPGAIRSLIDFYLHSARDETFRSRFRAYYDEMIEETAEVIRRGIREGSLSPEIDPIDAARTYLVGGDGILFVHTALDDFDRAVRTLRTFHDLFLRAITREGGNR